uniref:INO80 complex subunit B-like conserved region domain-containing protein n=1 Tax=Graphocephala atropunctata TaxID=36148 RepID=A0A1B6LC36_9HEMI
MGKRKDTSTEEEAILDGDGLPLGSPVKKHKKHKHKKHKKKKSEIDIEGKLSILKMPSLTPTSNEEDVDPSLVIVTSQASSVQQKSTSSSPSKGSAKKKKKGKESATSSEEERWLDAIESGKLEEVDDELKKIKPKDPKLMTARQRAMMERKTTDKEPNSSGEQLLALPTGYREKVMTPEMVLKAALKSQKRKQQADEKREKDKKKTMERLLRKQESKSSKTSGKSRAVRRQVPSVTLCYNPHNITLTMPPDMDFPMAAARSEGPPPVKLCGVQGCSNLKRYSCSKTGVPLCSLECYRKNIDGSRST